MQILIVTDPQRDYLKRLGNPIVTGLSLEGIEARVTVVESGEMAEEEVAKKGLVPDVIIVAGRAYERETGPMIIERLRRVIDPTIMEVMEILVSGNIDFHTEALSKLGKVRGVEQIELGSNFLERLLRVLAEASG